ncbi:MAG TPA: hypothetical protein VGI10_00475 [Polyangiaceae bacterium]
MSRSMPPGPDRHAVAARVAGEPKPRDRVVESWVPSWLAKVLIALAAGFFCALFGDASAARWVNDIPRPLRFFTQIAALFPYEDKAVLEYRAEGYDCQQQKFVELELRPYFPIDDGEKENRFFRTLQFYHSDRTTMRALAGYLIVRYNEAALAARSHGLSASPIGGVRFSSVHIPLGEPGSPVARFRHLPLASFPESYVKHAYYTPESQREASCRELGQ